MTDPPLCKGLPALLTSGSGIMANVDRPASRVAKFGPKKREVYFQALREGARRTAAAKAAGISSEWVRRTRKDDPHFAEQESEAELDANERVEDAMFKSALEGNVTAMQVWLYNRMPDRWADRRKAGG
jgi:hypothetical protein